MTCDCEVAAIYSAKVVKTKKPHECVECGEQIGVQSPAEKVDALWDGLFQTVYTCANCMELRDFLKNKFPDELCCHGELFEFIYESGFLCSEDEIETEAATWVQNYDSAIGVVRGLNCAIASPLTPWLIRDEKGNFRLSPDLQTRDRAL